MDVGNRKHTTEQRTVFDFFGAMKESVPSFSHFSCQICRSFIFTRRILLAIEESKKKTIRCENYKVRLARSSVPPQTNRADWKHQTSDGTLQTQKREQISLKREKRVSNKRSTIIWQFIFFPNISFRWHMTPCILLFDLIYSPFFFVPSLVCFSISILVRRYIYLITLCSSSRSLSCSIRICRPKTLDFPIPVSRSESVCFRISFFLFHWNSDRYI